MAVAVWSWLDNNVNEQIMICFLIKSAPQTGIPQNVFAGPTPKGGTME